MWFDENVCQGYSGNAKLCGVLRTLLYALDCSFICIIYFRLVILYKMRNK